MSLVDCMVPKSWGSSSLESLRRAWSVNRYGSLDGTTEPSRRGRLFAFQVPSWLIVSWRSSRGDGRPDHHKDQVDATVLTLCCGKGIVTDYSSVRPREGRIHLTFPKIKKFRNNKASFPFYDALGELYDDDTQQQDDEVVLLGDQRNSREEETEDADRYIEMKSKQSENEAAQLAREKECSQAADYSIKKCVSMLSTMDVTKLEKEAPRSIVNAARKAEDKAML
ncbi:hypothetical protein C2845_PM17G07570 [Panicum miliaceum]|uniref:Uncharacterized protein n=1 Tax=Panicum miliaceum TaxID=4540 RepID=A0A3L6Q2C2_PANMI|nr:hypothetical protein C2845_PM17G07570 [Panicum miliaceum]